MDATAEVRPHLALAGRSPENDPDALPDFLFPARELETIARLPPHRERPTASNKITLQRILPEPSVDLDHRALNRHRSRGFQRQARRRRYLNVQALHLHLPGA